MRGALELHLLSGFRAGIIPADAGSTEAHELLDMVQAGSSPRMRGAHVLPVKWDGWPRIIPADAGSTDTTLFIETVTQDHPRGCGEHT